MAECTRIVLKENFCLVMKVWGRFRSFTLDILYAYL